MSQDAQYGLTIDKAVMIPMSDGTRLVADIYRPSAEGQFPAIVERTPYNREESVILRTKTPQFFAERGFVFVVQDVRGRFASEGSWYPFVDDGWQEKRDGFDTIEWIAKQPWCNGNVGTAGGSYAGQTQMFVAPTRPAALKCCFVREAASDLAEQWCYRGGAFEWAFNCDWILRHGAHYLRRQLRILDEKINADESRFRGLPLSAGPEFSTPFGWIHDLLRRADNRAYWDQFNFEPRYSKIDVPIYHMAGWFDIFLQGSLRNFMGLQEEARSKETRATQKLIIGPWTHGPSVNDPAFARYVGDMDFGEQALVDFNAEHLRWYERWLKGTQTGVMDEARVRYFLMGANEWRTADRWPPLGATIQKWHFRGGNSGSATSLNDGRLTIQLPAKKEPADKFRYDPDKPVPTIGGNTLYCGKKRTATGEENPDFSVTAGPRDQRAVEPLCLTYTSDPLQADLDVVGMVSVELYASSNCEDTDFVAKLCDVLPDGRSILVVDGILRARYRRGRFRAKLLQPKKIYRLTIDLWSTAWRFAAGHRLRVAMASSNFPRFDRNLNTGANPAFSAKMVVATNRVYHDDKRPSHIALPVMPPA